METTNGENGSSKTEKKENRISYSVETPYGFHLDLDFLKYVHDIERGNTIKRIHIHRRAKQSKFSTLPRNFSVPDTGSQGYSQASSNTWCPSSYRAGPKDSEMFSGSESALRLRYVHELNYRRRDNIYDAHKALGELAPEDFSSCRDRPQFGRASSLPASLPQSTTSPDQCQYLRLPQSTSSFSESRLEFMKGSQHSDEQIAAAFKRIKELEEQLKTIPELKQTIFVLEEENNKLHSQLVNVREEQEAVKLTISESKAKAEDIGNGLHEAHDQSSVNDLNNSLCSGANQQIAELTEQLDDRSREVQNLRVLVEKQSNELKAKDVYIADLTRMMGTMEEARRQSVDRQHKDASVNTEEIQTVKKESLDKNTYANISVMTQSVGCGVLPADLDQPPDERKDGNEVCEHAVETSGPLTDRKILMDQEVVGCDIEKEKVTNTGAMESEIVHEMVDSQTHLVQMCDNSACGYEVLVDNKHCSVDVQPSTEASIGHYVKRIQDLLQEQWTCLEIGYPDLASAIKQPASKLSSIQNQLVNSLNLLSSVYSAQGAPAKETEKTESQLGETSPINSLKSIMKKKTNSGRSSSGSEARAKKNLQFVGVNGGYETTSSEDSSSSEEYGGGDVEKAEISTQDAENNQIVDLVIAETRDREEELQASPEPAGSETQQQSRCSVGDAFRSECQILCSHLSELRTTTDNKLRQTLYTVCQEWFRVSSQKSSSPDLVSVYLDEIRSISPQLLQMVVNIADENGNTALHYSVSHSNFAIVSLLLDTGVCDVDHQNKAGYTPVMLTPLASAETEDDMQVVKTLLSLGDVNLTASQGGQTALMLGISHGRSDMVKVLLECGADVNLQDEDGESALMIACQLGNVEIVKLILSRLDCDVELTDKVGNSALSIVAESAPSEIAELLQAHTEHRRSCPAADTGKGGPL
ncbi:PREDICTED: KN motif and ankyrin repeat domain-containing protein 4 [Nanorana parkeri]|uniref:KN motif and ankyrin repeat domain-containing protein 4 n=1 Tax=Nanorana parkeri TaxID=125878 RepID=UPI0008550C3D|nr:PREDICTED: KN motif and ankyrin repeat domain-containing protein 4 [Nanorana parkeri]